jgi:hypothetical protein
VSGAFETFCRNRLGLHDRDTNGMLNSNDGCTARNPARLLKIGRLRRDKLFGNFGKERSCILRSCANENQNTALKGTNLTEALTAAQVHGCQSSI